MNNVQFFGESGLTSTSANHVANLAKEWYRNIVTELEGINFIQRSIKLISSNTKDITEYPSTKEMVAEIPSKLKEIAEAKSLIAWLREALKCKRRIIKEIEEETFGTWCSHNNIEQPIFPDKDSTMTEAQYYNSLSIKDRNRYYYLETMAAVFGNYIHQDGKYSEARDVLNKVIRKPVTLEEDGVNTVIYYSEPMFTVEEVDNMYFNLQKLYREYQAELNGMKHNCELAIQKSHDDATSKFNTDYANYQRELAALQEQWNQDTYKRKEEAANLKIIIPNSLKDIYNKINSLGK